MAKKIKLELTEAQLIAIMEVTDECSAMIGCSNDAADKDRNRWVRLIDRMLKNNGHKRKFT